MRTVCSFCNREFACRQRRRFCSHRCSTDSNRLPPHTIATLKARCDTSGDCWKWLGAHYPNGYGVVWNGHALVSVHRFSWLLSFGPIPTGLLVCHHCDTRSCIRPEHLFLGTHQDNMTDALIKGRTARGTRVGTHKLVPTQVAAIRRRVRNGEEQKSLAREFSVSRATVCFIVHGKRWAKLPLSPATT
jgi:hypothetical protein